MLLIFGFAMGWCFSVVSRSATGTTQHCFPCKLSASSLLRPVDAFFAPRPCFSSLQHFAPPIDNDFSALVMLFLQLFPVLKFPALMFFATCVFPGKTPPPLLQMEKAIKSKYIWVLWLGLPDFLRGILERSLKPLPDANTITLSAIFR